MEFHPNTLDEGTDVRAIAFVAIADREVFAVNDIVNLAIRYIFAGTQGQQRDNLEFGQGQVYRRADPNRAEPASPSPQFTYPPGWVGRTYGGEALNAKSYEFYRPKYFFNGARPTITDVLRNGTSTRRIQYGQTFTITTPQAASINTVVIMRLGACTHHTDTEQRECRKHQQNSPGDHVVGTEAPAAEAGRE